MDTIKAKARAARQAQEELIDYARRVRAGGAKRDRCKADKLAGKCEETFRVWMVACVDFAVH